MMNLSATYKGLITGLLMIGVSIGIFYLKGNFDNKLQYIAYAMYIAGIVWTLFAFHKSSEPNKSFKNYFTQGFKCFIVVSFVMVLFTFIFLKLQPSFREEMAVNYKTELIKKGNYTPVEVDKMVTNAKEYFVAMLVSMAVFSYLVIGALVTLVISGFLSQSKRN
jgi:hypothetical protein